MKNRRVICNVPVSIGATMQLLSQELNGALTNESRLLVTCVNPHSTHLVKNHEFLALLEGFDYVLCDGQGLASAASWLTGIHTERLSFDATSLSPLVMEQCVVNGTPVYFVGGVPGTAKAAADVLSERYVGLKFSGAYSGYGSDIYDATRAILQQKYSVVIVGLGAVRQERFVASLCSEGWQGVAFTCGGYFDQVGRSDNYYPEWIDKLNLRFAYRFYMEPARLWRRYLLEYMPFILQFSYEITWLQFSRFISIFSSKRN